MNHTHAYDMLSLLRKCAGAAIKDNDQEPYSRNEYLQNMTDLSKDLTAPCSTLSFANQNNFA